MEHPSTPTPKLSGWPPQPPRQPAKFLRCRLTERPWLRQFNEERSKVFRAGHDTSLPESEVPSPGRWIRSGRHAGCGIDHALRRLSRPILCESHQVAVSCADPVQKQVPGECGWSGEGSAPPGLGPASGVWRGWGAGVKGFAFARPLDSPRPVTEADLSFANPIRWRSLAPTPYRSKSPASVDGAERDRLPPASDRPRACGEGGVPESRGSLSRGPLTHRGPLQKPTSPLRIPSGGGLLRRPRTEASPRRVWMERRGIGSPRPRTGLGRVARVGCRSQGVRFREPP